MLLKAESLTIMSEVCDSADYGHLPTSDEPERQIVRV